MPDDTPDSRSLTIAEQLYRRVGDDIRAGRLSPGAKLAFHNLRDHYGVSVSTTREALQRLAAEKLVVAEGRRGFRVAPLSLAELRELNDLRLLLEPRALHESVLKGDERWEEQVVLASHRLSRIRRPDNRQDEEADAWEEAHRAFHETLISACESRWLLQFCRTLYEQITRYRRLIIMNYVASDTLGPTIDSEHKRLLAAAVARDADAAVSVLTEHYENTARRLEAYYNESELSGSL